ncbi:MAG: ADP-ribosylglycohydrolase family protein [Cloacibacillus sp.]
MMLGALIGDIIGSVYEFSPTKSKDIEFISEKSRFTDDSILSVAVADAILHGYDYAPVLKYWGRCYPRAGYGKKFYQWCVSDKDTLGESFGNGSAMRVSPVGWSCDSLEEVLKEAKKSAAPSHSHPEGIKGAQAVASAVYIARNGGGKAEIKKYVQEQFGYDLGRTMDEIRPHYKFDATCPGSVPEALIAFLESDSFEDAVCGAVSLGGDADTQACIAGAVAEAFYGTVSKRWVAMLKILLPQDAVRVTDQFNKKFMDSRYNFFCCGKESQEGRQAEGGLSYDLMKLEPSKCRWWVKEPGTEDEVWAFAVQDEKSSGVCVYFSTDDPIIFDRLCYASFEDAFIALNRNGFDLHFENYEEGDNRNVLYEVAAPFRRFNIEEHPIFSTGKHWI